MGNDIKRDDLIRRSEFKSKCIEVLEGIRKNPLMSRQEMHVIAAIDTVCQIADDIPAVDAVEVDTVCEMMEFLFDDSCPCNYNSIDEWLPYVCEHQEECPKPTDKYGCWKQFIRHFGKRREDGDA